MLYLAVARLGMAMVLPGTMISVIWPPTGFALASLILLGKRYWPAVTLGAFAINVYASGSPFLAAGVATGNTCEALLGAYLYQRFIGAENPFTRSRNVGRFFGVALIAPLASALIGVAANYLFDEMRPSMVGSRIVTWWIENAASLMVICPFLLAWAPRRFPSPSRPRVATLLFIGVLLAVSGAVFGSGLGRLTLSYPLDYMSLPFLIGAAFYMGVRGTTLVVLVVTLLPIFFTHLGAGPFHRINPFDSLSLLQMYVATHAVTGLFLTALVAEREEANRQLSQTNGELERFAIMATQDLKEPLRTVNSFSTLLDRKYRDRLDAEGVDYLTFIEKASLRMSSLVNSMLEYSRLSTPVVGVPMETTPVLQEVLQALAPRLANVTVKWEPLPTVRSDRHLLALIFTNLIDNAIRFQSERPLRIEIRAQIVGRRVNISVADNGIGIEPQYLPRMFGAFQRFAPPGPGGRGDGAGFGLALCRRILENQGQKIWVESEPGIGSRFYFSLPLA
jgi:signal transduction histidine kinase